MAWTAPRVTLLLDFWAAGWPPVQIAFVLETTRLAVSGKIERLRAREQADMMQADLIRRLALLKGGPLTLEDILCRMETGPPRETLRALGDASRGQAASSGRK